MLYAFKNHIYKMRNIYIISSVLIMLVLGNVNINCQTDIGIKLGYNLTNFDFGRNTEVPPGLRQMEDYKEVKAVHLGAFVTHKLKNKFDLNMSLFYIGKGQDTRPNTSNLILRNNISLNLSLRYEVLARLYTSLGGELNSTFSIYQVNNLEFRNVSKAAQEQIFPNNIRPGYVFGVQYRIAPKWELDVRYVRTLLKSNGSFDHIIYERTYMFSINMYFGNKKESIQ